MLQKTHSAHAPWTVVTANDKHAARLNVIRDLLSRAEYRGQDKKLLKPDPAIIHLYDDRLIDDGVLAI
jgi:hypothetical protein